MENVKTESNQIYIKDPSTMEAKHNEQKLWNAYRNGFVCFSIGKDPEITSLGRRNGFKSSKTNCW